MRALPLLVFVAVLAACGGKDGTPPTPASTTTTPFVLYNDGHMGTIVTRRENVFGPDAETYDVRDLDKLHGAVEVLLLRLPDLAREYGATHADLGDGCLRVIGPSQAHALVREVIAVLRAAPGPRS